MPGNYCSFSPGYFYFLKIPREVDHSGHSLQSDEHSKKGPCLLEEFSEAATKKGETILTQRPRI